MTEAFIRQLIGSFLISIILSGAIVLFTGCVIEFMIGAGLGSLAWTFIMYDRKTYGQ